MKTRSLYGKFVIRDFFLNHLINTVSKIERDTTNLFSFARSNLYSLFAGNYPELTAPFEFLFPAGPAKSATGWQWIAAYTASRVLPCSAPVSARTSPHIDAAVAPARRCRRRVPREGNEHDKRGASWRDPQSKLLAPPLFLVLIKSCRKRYKWDNLKIKKQ